MGLDIYAGPLTRYYSHNWKIPEVFFRAVSYRFTESGRSAPPA